MRRREVLSRLKNNRDLLAQNYGVSELYLFGSVARNQAHKKSDVDLLVEFIRPIGLFDFIELKQTLEEILDCKVDLGTKRSLKIQYKDKIMREAIRVT